MLKFDFLKLRTFNFNLFLILFLASVAIAQDSGDQLDMARKAYANSNFDKAAKHLEFVLKERPNSDEAYFFKGKCKIELDQYNEALDNFTSASNIDPQEPEYYYYKGMCEWKLKRMQAAINSIEKSLVYNPDNFLAYKLLGSIYYELNITDKAKQYFDKAIEIKPDFNANVFTKSKVEDYVEAYKVAMRASNRDTKKEPNNPIAKFYLGLLKAIGRDNWGAYLDFNQVVEIDPELAVTYYYKGYVEFNIKKFKDALEDLHKYSKKYPADEKAKALLKSVEAAANVKVMDNNDTDEILLIAEEMPEFVGGTHAMQKFISENIQYPRQAMQLRLQGRVMVAFIVDKEGKIKDMEVLKGVGGGCELEALRVISLMPKWKPGKQNGQNVAVRYTLPIKFALSE